jgi:hypothetical protein
MCRRYTAQSRTACAVVINLTAIGDLATTRDFTTVRNDPAVNYHPTISYFCYVQLFYFACLGAVTTPDTENTV